VQAAANAKHNSKAMKTKLFVAECFADGGPTYKRFQERAKGSAYRINKPTFHLTIRVEERQ
jgi:large subunit ribosomal protein L22